MLFPCDDERITDPCRYSGGSGTVLAGLFCGYRLEKGYEILIEQDKIIGEVENTQTIVVFWNDSVYKEFAFDGNDIEFEIDKSGNYSFYAIDSNGNSFDIMSIVKAYKSADGGVMPL